jgi:hypothetical protein
MRALEIVRAVFYKKRSGQSLFDNIALSAMNELASPDLPV